MKIYMLLFNLIFLSCIDHKTNEIHTKQTEITNKKELTFNEIQDSLRTILLKSKSNENLKSSILQELYIRGLVNQFDDKIKFDIPFNLHGFDCGAPDCYSTDISFEIKSTNPIVFPKKINFKLTEYGCGIENEITKSGVFELMEQSQNYVNYYSKKQQSNLVILGKERKLYYFPETKLNSIKVELIDKIFEEYNEKNENAIAPYQSTTMTTNEYENFIKY